MFEINVDDFPDYVLKRCEWFYEIYQKRISENPKNIGYVGDLCFARQLCAYFKDVKGEQCFYCEAGGHYCIFTTSVQTISVGSLICKEMLDLEDKYSDLEKQLDFLCSIDWGVENVSK